MNGCDQGHISCIALPMSAKHTDAHTPIQSGAPAAKKEKIDCGYQSNNKNPSARVKQIQIRC